MEADLIVIGNKGMTGAKRFFTASVPGRVSEQADRDVLVCRTVVQAVRELEPGQGGIVEQQGEKLAAFMDAAGELHLHERQVHAPGVHGGVEPRRGDVRLSVPRLAVRADGRGRERPGAAPAPARVSPPPPALTARA